MIALEYAGQPLVLPSSATFRTIRDKYGYSELDSVFWEYGHGCSTPAHGVMLILGKYLNYISTEYNTLRFADDQHKDLTKGAPTGFNWIITFENVKIVRREVVIPNIDVDDVVWAIWLEDARHQIAGSAKPISYNTCKRLSNSPLKSGDTHKTYYEVLKDCFSKANPTGGAVDVSFDGIGTVALKPRNVVVGPVSPCVAMDAMLSDLCGVAVFQYDGLKVFVTKPGSQADTEKGSAKEFHTFYNSKGCVRRGSWPGGRSALVVPKDVRGVFAWEPGSDPTKLYYDELTSATGRPSFATGTNTALIGLPLIAEGDPVPVPPATSPVDPTNKSTLQMALDTFAGAYFNQFTQDPFDIQLPGFLYFPPSAEYTTYRLQLTSAGPETLLIFKHQYPEKIEPKGMNHITESTGAGEFYHRGVWNPCGWVTHEIDNSQEGFWAKIAYATLVAPNQWQYEAYEVEKTVGGYGGWTTVDGGVSSTLVYNSIEDTNTGVAGHTEGNGVDPANLDTDFSSVEMKPCTVGNVVWVKPVKVPATEGHAALTEYWFSYENGVDGECL